MGCLQVVGPIDSAEIPPNLSELTWPWDDHQILTTRESSLEVPKSKVVSSEGSLLLPGGFVVKSHLEPEATNDGTGTPHRYSSLAAETYQRAFRRRFGDCWVVDGGVCFLCFFGLGMSFFSSPKPAHET